MSCYHPKKAFIVGINPETNKKILKIRPFEVKYLEKYKNKWIDAYDHPCRFALNCGEKLCDYKCGRFSPEWSDSEHSKFYYDFLVIPCGQCLGCRMEYSRQWAIRMMLEKKYSENCYFITLTYDDAFLNKDGISWSYYTADDVLERKFWQYPNVVEFADRETGELLEHMTLNKEDLVHFNKRLRKRFGEGIRFFATGEYGSKSMRPHYHAIYFNLPLEDLKFFKHDRSFNYYTSDEIAKLWPYGFHLITQVNFDTCAYVSRYVTKKATGEGAKEKYEKLGILPEFSLMSRRPGIGRRWFDDNFDRVYETNIITVSDLKGGHQFRPPSYYNRLFEVLDPERMAEIKEDMRSAGQSISRLKLDNTDLGFLEMLEAEEYNFQHNPRNKYGLLKRKDL